MPGAGRLVTVSVLICSDLDGTLIPDGTADESPGARERFARCAALPEVALAYVTGRDRRLVEDAIAEFSLPRPDFVVGDVGATVYDLGTGEWKAVERWRRLLAREWGGGAVSELAASLSGLPELELQETSKQHDFKLSYYLEATSEESDVLSSVRGRLSSLEIPVRLVFSRDRTGVGLVDLLPPSAGKLSAVQFLVEWQAIAADRVLFAGDSGNDLDVLASRVPSVLVANASDEVKARACALAEDDGTSDFLYLAGRGVFGMNGNYAAGVLEGLTHFLPETAGWIS